MKCVHADASGIFQVEILTGQTTKIVFREEMTGTQFLFDSPSGIAYISDDKAVLSDAGAHKIILIDLKARRVRTLSGANRVCYSITQIIEAVGSKACEVFIQVFLDGANPLFNMPTGLAYHAASQRILVTDQKNHAIRQVSLNGGSATTLFGQGNPCSSTCRDDYQGSYAEGQGTNATFNQPSSIALVPGRNWAVVTDSFNHRIRLLDLDTRVTSLLAGAGRRKWTDGIGALASFSFPTGLAFAPGGNTAYISDTYHKVHNRIRSLDLNTREVKTLAGPGLQNAQPGSDGEGTVATFSQPAALTYKQHNMGDWLVIADTGSHRIRMLPLGSSHYENGTVPFL
jgi:DNA-binding beta-propeller fold protein YncE